MMWVYSFELMEKTVKRIVLVLTLILSTMLVSACSPSVANQKIAPNAYVSQYAENATPHLLVDVRTAQEYAEGHIAGSVNIPLQDLSLRMNEIPMDRPAIIYCRSGNRSAQAMSILAGAGYTQIYDLGGIIEWTQAGYGLQ
jgi:rhodanese-related sulfurtransferase